MNKFTLAVFLLLAICFAFGVSVYRRNRVMDVGELVVREKPAESVFVGRWQLQSASLPSVTNRTGNMVARPELTLRADGRFMANDFPIEDSFSSPKWRLKSGEGYWKLYRNQYWVVSLGFADGFSTPLDIRLQNGRIATLTYSVGDPDSNERWIWRRVAE